MGQMLVSYSLNHYRLQGKFELAINCIPLCLCQLSSSIPTSCLCLVL